MTAGVPALGGRRAYLVWLPAVAVYFLAVFHRSSLGVAGLAATERFDISASALSSFTVLQLLVYAGMQIPVGVMLDRFGARTMLVAGAFVMTAAQLGFALTGSYAGAVAARVFVGMGDAMVFISVLRLIAAWFPPMRNPVLTAWTALIGQSGALVAAVPLARSLDEYGWTTTFAVSAGALTANGGTGVGGTGGLGGTVQVRVLAVQGPVVAVDSGGIRPHGENRVPVVHVRGLGIDVVVELDLDSRALQPYRFDSGGRRVGRQKGERDLDWLLARDRGGRRVPRLVRIERAVPVHVLESPHQVFPLRDLVELVAAFLSRRHRIYQ